MNGTRTLKLVSLALATALLGGGAWLAQGGLKQLARERQQFAQLQQELDNQATASKQAAANNQAFKEALMWCVQTGNVATGKKKKKQ